MSPLVIVFISVFIDLLGFGIVLPLMPYYALRFDADAFGVGALLAIYSLMQLFFSPLWGRLSDRIGRRPVLIVSLFGSAIGLILFGLASSLAGLFLARMFSGMATATVSVAQAYIADCTPPEKRARGMGLIGAAFGLGFIFGPALGGLLAGYGASVPAYVAAAIAGINGVLAIFFLPETLPPEKRGLSPERGFSIKRLGTAASVPGMSRLMLLYFLSIFGFATMEATFPLLTLGLFNFNEQQNGFVFAYLGVLVALLQGGLIGRLVARFGEPRLVVVGAGLMTVAFIALPVVPSIGFLLLALIPLAVGNGVCNPCLTALISRRSDAIAQGETLGVAQSMASLGRITGPLWGGFCFARFGAITTYWLAAVVLAILTVLALALRQSAAVTDTVPEVV